jgi:uncharacterized membrane protein YphA (DoxX/SURF4 family)
MASRKGRTQGDNVPPHILTVIRCIVALVWLYEGLWMKLAVRDPHELAIVAAVGGPGGLTPSNFLTLIGVGETLLALGVLSGLLARPLAALQIFLLIAMNGIGIVWGGGNIAHPVGLLIKNLPFLTCIYLVGRFGPGSHGLTALFARRRDVREAQA